MTKWRLRGGRGGPTRRHPHQRTFVNAGPRGTNSWLTRFVAGSSPREWVGVMLRAVPDPRRYGQPPVVSSRTSDDDASDLSELQCGIPRERVGVSTVRARSDG